MTLMRDFCALSKEKKVPYERWQVKLLFQRAEKCPLKGGKSTQKRIFVLTVILTYIFNTSLVFLFGSLYKIVVLRNTHCKFSTLIKALT